MVIEQIKPQTQEELFVKLYEMAFPQVAGFIHKMGGSFDEAKDIFQDGLVIYYEKRIGGNTLTTVDDKAYLLGICRHLWYKYYHENKLKQALEHTPDLKLTEEHTPKVSEDILRFVELSGKKCLDLLKAFYYDKLNMKELATRFGFSGERSATVQKYKCLEKVRITIRDKSLNKEDFYE